MLTIHGRATSSNVQAVMWLVGELGLPHRRIDRGHVHGGLDDPAFRALSPVGLVPVLEDGDLAVFESGAILRYLAAAYGRDTSFYQSEPRRAAEIDRWTEFGASTVKRAFTAPIFWARVRTAAKDRGEAALARAIIAFEGHLAILSEQLGDKPFLCGDDLTLADIVSGHVLYRYYDIDIPRNGPPAIRALYERYAQRPAFREHVMVSYDPLRVAGA